MTRALVISDNHGDRAILRAISTQWKDRVDVMIHCGDSELPASDPIMQPFYRVGGNNDWQLGYQDNQVLSFGGQRFFITHGHHDRVNFSMTPLMLRGQSAGADVVCFGHTHQLFAAVEGKMLLINPGSISLPRGRYAGIGGTFAVVEADRQRFLVDFFNRQSEIQPKLHREFSRQGG